jgi:hypothetical protein
LDPVGFGAFSDRRLRRPRELSRCRAGTSMGSQALVPEHADTKARYRHWGRFARTNPKIWAVLWAFAKHPRVLRTDNHAALGGAVIYLKLRLGSRSDDVGRRIARIFCPHRLPAAGPLRACLSHRFSVTGRGPTNDLRPGKSPT